MNRKKTHSVLLPMLWVALLALSLPLQAQSGESKLTYVADGSNAVQSFSVRTTYPNTKVTVTFPDGIVAEAVSDGEYRLTQFAHRIKDVAAPWTIEIKTEGIASFASQQTGITNVTLEGCKEIKRITLPYQNLENIQLSGLGELEELYLQGNTKLRTVDVATLTSLKILNLSNTENLVLTGLDKCTSLNSLYAYNSSLSNPRLATLTQLKVLDLTNTKTSAIDLSANTQLTEVQLTDNQLTDIDLSALKELQKLGIGKNKLQYIDLSENKELTELDVNGNQLHAFNIAMDALTSLDCGANHLPLSQLPMRGELTTYIYWPQKDFAVAKQIEVGRPMDLSREAKATGVAQSEKKTTFFVYDSDGNMLSEGDDYTCTEGVFVFTKAFEKPLRIKIKTDAFPKLKDKNALYSSYFTVVNKVNALFGLPDEAFKGCTHLTEIALPANTQTIGAHAFSDCPALAKVVVAPAKLATMGSDAFPDREGLVIYVADAEQMAALYAQYHFIKTRVTTATPTAITSVVASEPYHIRIAQGCLTVTPTDHETTVSIFRLDGTCEAQRTALRGESLSFSLTQGVYIVRIGHHSVRVLIP